MTTEAPLPDSPHTIPDDITSWADMRGFRPAISYSESTSTIIERRFTHVPGHYLVVFQNGDIFIGMTDDLGQSLAHDNDACASDIIGIRVMARSTTGLELVNEALKMQREAKGRGWTVHPRPRQK